MRICIPTVDERGYESEAHDHLGSAPFFTVVDMDSDEIKIVRNPDCHHHPGTCHHVPLLLAQHVDLVACKAVGHRSFEALNEAGIGVLAPVTGTVARVLETIRSGNVSRLSADEARRGGLHGRHGGAGHGRHGIHGEADAGHQGRGQGVRRDQHRRRLGAAGGGQRQRQGGGGPHGRRQGAPGRPAARQSPKKQ